MERAWCCYLLPMTTSERLEICKQCEHFEPVLQRCKLCGCLMYIKVRFPQAKCPDGRW